MTSCLLPEMIQPFQMGSTLNPIALSMAKTLWSFGHSECNRVKEKNFLLDGQVLQKLIPSEKEGKHENCRVTALESVPIYLKTHCDPL